VTDILALCYHAISPSWTADLSATPEQLEGQLRRLIDRGYRGATFHQAVTAPPAPRTVAVTFDDGFRSVYEHARGVLDRLAIPGTVFVVTDFVGTRTPMSWPGIQQWSDGPDAAELMPCSWDELGELAAAGWEIGSHTATHPLLTHCDDAALERELRGSRERCEARLGRACRSLAYPYGAEDQRVAEAAAAAGYLTACTLPVQLRRPTPLRWPRVGVWHQDGDVRFRLKVSRGFRELRALPAWTRVDTVRHALAGGRDR
jgi:peptidoglycan/xylan/chitin deacetylase (PgdA/CDA1 family)